MPTHSIEKTAKADSEKLPDINGTKITYAGGVECQITVMERTNAEPTVTSRGHVYRRWPLRRLRVADAPRSCRSTSWMAAVVWETTHGPRHRGRLRLGKWDRPSSRT